MEWFNDMALGDVTVMALVLGASATGLALAAWSVLDLRRQHRRELQNLHALRQVPKPAGWPAPPEPWSEPCRQPAAPTGQRRPPHAAAGRQRPVAAEDAPAFPCVDIHSGGDRTAWALGTPWDAPAAAPSPAFALGGGGDFGGGGSSASYGDSCSSSSFSSDSSSSSSDSGGSSSSCSSD